MMNVKDPGVLARLLKMEEKLVGKRRRREAMNKAYKKGRKKFAIESDKGRCSK